MEGEESKGRRREGDKGGEGRGRIGNERKENDGRRRREMMGGEGRGREKDREGEKRKRKERIGRERRENEGKSSEREGEDDLMDITPTSLPPKTNTHSPQLSALQHNMGRYLTYL